MNTTNNEFKIPNFIMFQWYVYTSYKQNGFVKGTINIYNYLKINLFGYLYKNCEWFRNFLKKKVKDEIGLILLDMLYSYEDWSLNKLLNNYPQFKETFINNFEQIKEESCNRIIKELNITDENEIQKIKNNFKLENYVDS